MGEKPRILLITKEPVGDNMNAMGIRYFEFAKFLASKYEVKLIAPTSGGDLNEFGFDYTPFNFKNCASSIYKSDILIATNPHPLIILIARLFKKKIILDLYDPTLIENIERIDFLPLKEKMLLYSIFVSWIRLQIRQSDYYICANEHQKDLWLGILALLGKLNPKSYSLGKNAEGLISIIPTGIPDEPPKESSNVLRETIPGISRTDKILLWVGSPSRYFDEKSLIYAMQDISNTRNDIKLVFICGSPESNNLLKENIQLSDSLDLTGKTIHFAREWIPYNEIADYYLEADIGISLHYQHLETHFSMRNRILGYLWGGLPVIVTEGDNLAELVERDNLGIVVKEKNKEELASAILRLVDNESAYENCKTALRKTMPAYKWRNILARMDGVITFLTRAESKSRFVGLFELACSLPVFASKYLYYRIRHGTTQSKIGRTRLV